MGALTKPEVREHARRLGLRVADKPDSQEICFVPDGDYAGFIERHGQVRPPEGPIVDVEGRVVGRHGGIHRFTVGQRKGLGLSAGRAALRRRRGAGERTVVVGPARGAGRAGRRSSAR